MFDPLTQVWTDGTNLPKPMTAFALAPHADGSLILLGGKDSNRFGLINIQGIHYHQSVSYKNTCLTLKSIPKLTFT